VIGGIVGGVLGALIALGLGVWFLRRRRRSIRTSRREDTHGPAMAQGEPESIGSEILAAAATTTRRHGKLRFRDIFLDSRVTGVER
jgi:hypothetical protein